MTLNFKQFHERHGENFKAIANGATFVSLRKPDGPAVSTIQAGVRQYVVKLRRFLSIYHTRFSVELHAVAKALTDHQKKLDRIYMKHFVEKYLPMVLEVAYKVYP